ncbi:cell differentiation protein, putative [Plasmodium knowlesi strain H]|uniref:Cell differentiation protein, putative n=3 Tax=Plasmodium knowlesi TaxID=5850 RepID=A0A5K1TXJ6_PLAKH|nr:protein CAF40, putative [Plasmodium knowlesi strain H]OTN67045.1 putative Cell differentiation protein rcd1 [Plasmodium knowlesi]CAA9988764.1 protein CAF40, putative [Plasmodium knowlesi strain H]SBO21713.1 cell differentiation protein, putative [Plasmodium knowlesi strain H]SBO22100.1 cell differentiation protein, putative [Plasmodium knowlesi strain H]VVS78238.1 protein CAF40, putative [Plasmodium knowlesi strain H]|eukprot:XP_002259740.1 cell differentiation protein rcd1, putative [Plasmodium knowlesi strain H]
MVSNEGFASGYKVNNANNVNASVGGIVASGNTAVNVSSVNSAPGLGSRGGAYRHSTNEISASRGTAGRNNAARGNPSQGNSSQSNPSQGNSSQSNSNQGNSSQGNSNQGSPNQGGPNMGISNLSTPSQGGPPMNGVVAAPPNNGAQEIAQGSTSAAGAGGHSSPQHQGSSSTHGAIPPTSNTRNVKNSNTSTAISNPTGNVGPHAQHNESLPNESNNGNGIGSTGTSSTHPNNPSNPRNTPPGDDEEKRKVYQLVFDLCYTDKRESALLELSRKRETYQDIAPVLWNSFGTITTLLQEIVSIYPQLSPPLLTTSSSNRVCNSLALLQCVASHPETKQHFLNAHIPLFLYPFLNAESKNRPFEYLRLTSLGVIGALVKVDNPDVINFLLQTEIIPLCLRIMETGSELSKTVATFIVQKILIDELGLNYICATPVRFYAVSTVLANMVNSLIENPSSRLLKHIVRCYLRLSENPKALKALRECLPESLRHVHKAFIPCLKEDPYTKKWLLQLLYNINSEDALHGHVGMNNASGNHVGGNHVGGNHVGGNHVGGNHVGGNHASGNHASGNHVGGNHHGTGSHTGNHLGPHGAGQGAGAPSMHTRDHIGGHTTPHSGVHSGVSGGHPSGRQGLYPAGGSKSTYAGVSIAANMSEGSSVGGANGGHGNSSHVGGAHPSGGVVSSSNSNSFKDKVNIGSVNNPNVNTKAGTFKAMAKENSASSSAEACTRSNSASNGNVMNNANSANNANNASSANSANNENSGVGAMNNTSCSNGTNVPSAHEGSSGEGTNNAGKASINGKTDSNAANANNN